MANQTSKTKAIVDYMEKIFETPAEDLEANEVYSKTAKGVLENQPELWQSAMIYLRLLNRQLNRLDALDVVNGRLAFVAYAAKCQLEHGEKDLMEVAAEFYDPKQPKVVDLDDLKHFDRLFEYPCRISFTPRAHAEIVRRILHDKISDRQIDFYLGTEESSDFGYSQLYPALKHILLTMHDDHLFWTAGDVLAIIWRLLPDDNKALDSWFNQELYNIFWPRANDQRLELLVSEQQIADDALGWVVNNPDCKKFNPELWQRLEQIASNPQLGADEIRLMAVLGQVYNIRTEKMSPARKFDFVAQLCEGEDLYNFFCRPGTIEEAEIYLEKAFDEYKFSPEECQAIIWNDDDPRRSYWRKTVEAHKILLAEPLHPEVQEFVLHYVVDNFDRVSWHDSNSAMQLLWAACTGAVQPSKTREALGEKCRKLLSEESQDTQPVDAALQFAQEQIDFRIKQSRDLVQNLRKCAEQAEK